MRAVQRASRLTRESKGYTAKTRRSGVNANPSKPTRKTSFKRPRNRGNHKRRNGKIDRGSSRNRVCAVTRLCNAYSTPLTQRKDTLWPGRIGKSSSPQVPALLLAGTVASPDRSVANNGGLHGGTTTSEEGAAGAVDRWHLVGLHLKNLPVINREFDGALARDAREAGRFRSRNQIWLIPHVA